MGLSSLLTPQYLTTSTTISFISFLLLLLTPTATSPVPINKSDGNLNSNSNITTTAAPSSAGTTGDAKSCALPDSGGVVSISPNGWALPPDLVCEPGSYCPYACPPGQLMGQWNPNATSYQYPENMAGGLYCNEDGSLSTPFPGKPLCYEGKGTVLASSSAGPVAFCQTVLPGREDMLIPNLITDDGGQVLAVPGPEYWCGTSAHFYVNPPGVSVADGCRWGTSSKPEGNWAPYVAGTNMDENGTTFAKIGWNPEYLDAFPNTQPSFGLRIISDSDGNGDDDCDGLPCEIGPGNDMESCVVGARNGSKLKIEVFNIDSTEDDDDDGFSKFNATATTSQKVTDTTSTTTPSRSTTIILQKRDVSPLPTSTANKSPSSARITSGASVTKASSFFSSSPSGGVSDETSTTTRTSTITVTVTLKNVHASTAAISSKKN